MWSHQHTYLEIKLQTPTHGMLKQIALKHGRNRLIIVDAPKCTPKRGQAGADFTVILSSVWCWQVSSSLAHLNTTRSSTPCLPQRCKRKHEEICSKTDIIRPHFVFQERTARSVGVTRLCRPQAQWFVSQNRAVTTNREQVMSPMWKLDPI